MGMKRRNAELYLKGTTVIYGFQLLAADCSPSQKDHGPNQHQRWKGWTALIGSIPSAGENIGANFQPITCRVCVEKKLFTSEVHFTEMTKDRQLANERYCK